MTSDEDRLTSLEKQVGDLWEVVRALEGNIQAIDGTLAKQARFIRYLEGQAQDIDGRIRSHSTTGQQGEQRHGIHD